MVLDAKLHPGLLKDMVASPGGTTIAGLHALEHGGLRAALMDAVRAGFDYFEREAGGFPTASAHERLGFTRREQQIIPLVAQGLSNKEIANHFFLSEQTIKNHLYRMKQKAGADDRLGIVRLCRTQGFLV